jgi:hypothetical protein
MADNIDVTPGSGKTVATDEIASIHYQIVKIATGADGAATLVSDAAPLPTADETAKVDDSAFTLGTDPVLAVGGVYQGAVEPSIESGYMGALRMTPRRALVTVPDYRDWAMNASGIQTQGPITVSTTSRTTGYDDPTAAFFDGSDAGFDASERWMRVGLRHYRNCVFLVRNTLDVSVDVTIYGAAQLANPSFTIHAVQQLASAVTLATNGNAYFVGFTPSAGADADIVTIASLDNAPYGWLCVSIDPASDPSSGSIWFAGTIKAAG